MLPAIGDVIDGKYEIVRLIGEGGMGSVFEARHKVLGTPVALKFLDPELSQNPALVARFVQEARVSATVRSPHVVQVFDVSPPTEAGGAHLVMEMLSGETLGERLHRVGRLDRDDAIEVALQVLEGLEVAHGLGVVHRDLKPDNVFLTSSPGSIVKILDFGIAKLKQSADFSDVVTRPGSMMGTPAYMAPEQAIAAEQVDPRADLYSLGVILYEMLTGALPVDDDDPSVIIEKVMKRQGVPILTRDPALPAELAELVTRALSPNPADRPASATELRRTLVALARTQGMTSSVAGVGSVTSSVPSTDRRESNVPPTVPPDDVGPPPSIVGGAEVLRHMGTGTLGPEGVLPARHPRTVPDEPSADRARAASRRRSGVVGWLLLIVTLGAGAVGGGYYSGWFETSPEPPLLPEPPSLGEATTELAPPTPRPLPLPSPRPRRSPSPSHPRPASEPAPPAPAETPTGVPLPTIQIPSSLPLPAGLPTLIPPGFPGAAPRVAPTPSPSPSSPAEAPSAP